MTQVNPGGIFATTPILIPVSLKNKPKPVPVFNQQPYPKYIPRNIQMPGAPKTGFMSMMNKNPNIINNMSLINQQGKKQNYRGFNVGNKNVYNRIPDNNQGTNFGLNRYVPAGKNMNMYKNNQMNLGIGNNSGRQNRGEVNDNRIRKWNKTNKNRYNNEIINNNEGNNKKQYLQKKNRNEKFSGVGMKKEKKYNKGRQQYQQHNSQSRQYNQIQDKAEDNSYQQQYDSYGQQQDQQQQQEAYSYDQNQQYQQQNYPYQQYDDQKLQPQYQNDQQQQQQQYQQQLSQNYDHQIQPQQIKPIKQQIKYISQQIKPQKKKPKPKIPSLITKQSLDQQVNHSQRCTTMCPKDQFQQRKNIFKQNNRSDTLKLDNQHSFAYFQINKQTKQPDFSLTIKRFKRSVIVQNDQVQQKQLVRSPEALKKTIHYIINNIVDADNMKYDYHAFIVPQNEKITFVHIHEFLWNRLRGVIRDISQLSIKQQRSRQIIILSEYITRFFILSINERRSNDQMFDQKMNMQNLQKIITPLLSAYKHNKLEFKRILNELMIKNQLTQQSLQRQIKSRQVYLSPYQPEITAYALVISNQRNSGKLQQIYQMFKECDENPLLQSQSIQTAFQMRYCISSHNFQRYFSLLEKQSISLLLSSAFLFHIMSMRKSAISTIMKCWKQKNDDNINQILSFQLIGDHLGFKQKYQQIKQFLLYIGAKLNMDQSAIFSKELGEPQQGKGYYHIPKYEFKTNKKLRKLYGNPQCKKKILTPSQISRQQLIIGIGVNHHNYHIKVKNTLKGFYWKINQINKSIPNQIIQSQDNQIRDQGDIQQQIMQKSQEQNIIIQKKQQQNILKIIQQKQKQNIKFIQRPTDPALQKLKLKIKRKTFLSKIHKKLEKLFRNCRDRTIMKRCKLQRLCEIFNMKIQKQKRIFFNQISYFEEVKTFLSYYFKKLKNKAIQNKLFKYYLNDQQNDPKPYQYIKTKPNQIKTIQYINSLQFNLRKLQNFHNFIVETFSNVPNSILRPLNNYDFKITILLSKIQLSDPKYFQDLLNLLTANRSNTFYSNFISSLINTYTFQTIIRFFINKNQFRQINYYINLIKVNQQKEVNLILQENLYGTDLLIIPQIDTSFWLIKYFMNSMNKIRFRLDKIKTLFIRAYKTIQQKKLHDKIHGQMICDQQNIAFVEINLNRSLVCLQVQMKLKQCIRQMIDSKSFFPKLEILSVGSLIMVIRSNLEYLKQINKDEQKKLVYYQQYINQCFDQIKQTQEIIYQKRQKNANWKKLIAQLTQYYDQKQSTQSCSKSFRSAYLNIFQKLEISFYNQKYYKSINKKQFLFNQISSYLHGFLQEDIDTDVLHQLINSIKSQTYINSVQLVDGNIQKIFINVLDYLIQIFELCNVKVIMPKNFKFDIQIHEFYQRVDSKYYNTIQSSKTAKKRTFKQISIVPKIKKSRIEQNGIQENQTGCIQNFVYEHQKIFDQIRKRKKIQKVENIQL